MSANDYTETANEIVASFADRLGAWMGYPLISAITTALRNAHEDGRRAMCIQAGGYPDSDLDGWAVANVRTVEALDVARAELADLRATLDNERGEGAVG